MAETPHLTPAKAAERSARETRLARALRENLRRRKEQSRARPPDAADTAEGDGKPAEPAA